MTAPATPVFLLGVGAQKAGTTWLYHQLSKSPSCNLGFTKEYHIWDAVYAPVVVGRPYRVPVVKPEPTEAAFRRLMQTVGGVYEHYFRQLITDQVRLVGDITPSYCTLDVNAYRNIKRRLESVGFRMKVVYLMRDPVERAWSALRMVQRQRLKAGEAIADEALLALFSDFYRNAPQSYRGNYPRTVTALRQCFDSDDLFIGFYETLFEPATLSALSAFLDVDLRHADVEERVNVSKPIPLPTDLRRACQAFHREVYAFCHAQFPVTRQLWPAKVADEPTSEA